VEEDAARLEEDAARLEEDAARLEEDAARLEEDAARLEEGGRGLGAQLRNGRACPHSIKPACCGSGGLEIAR
jgi:hypothetical protein